MLLGELDEAEALEVVLLVVAGLVGEKDGDGAGGDLLSA